MYGSGKQFENEGQGKKFVQTSQNYDIQSCNCEFKCFITLSLNF